MSLLQPPESPSPAYRLALSGAALLFLAVLTIALLILLLDDAREHNQQAEFTATLTAIATDLSFEPVQPPEAGGDTPLVAGQFPFVLHDGTVTYGAGSTCDVQEIGGQVTGEDGQPTDALTLLVWGDYVAPRLVLTGEIAGYAPGRWGVTLPGNVPRRVWVQVTGAGQMLSAPVEVVFNAGDCVQNAAQLIFEWHSPGASQ